MNDDIYIALGKLTVYYTRLEFFLIPIFNDLKSTDNGGLVFLKNKGVKKMTKQINKYSQEKIKDQDLRDRISYLMNAVNEVRKKRNNLLHSIFFQDSKTHETIQIDLLASRTQNQNMARPVTSNDIDKVSKEAKTLSTKIKITILNLNKERESNGTI